MSIPLILLFADIPPSQQLDAFNELVNDINDRIALVAQLVGGGPYTKSPAAVASLPAGAEGDTCYATNGRKVGETTGNGTGVPVYFSNTKWRVWSTDAQVLA